LGNVRLSYFKNPSGSAEVLEENNFYPFGMKHEGYNQSIGNLSYNYQYNGKELQKETGWSDYGARMYMSDIGRWGVIDPLAETSRRFNPYNYAYNNPISFIDPDGRKAMAPIGYEALQPMNGALGFITGGGSAVFGSFEQFLGQSNPLSILRERERGSGGGSTTFGETQAYRDIMAQFGAEPETESESYFQNINFTQFGADGGPGGPSAQLSDPIIGKKVLDAKTSFLGRLWANGEPRTWTENGITYNVDADGKISGVRPYQGDVPLGPAGNLKGLKSLFTFTKSAGKHFTDIVKSGENASRLARPYMRSSLIIQEIIATGKGIPDATAKGALNFRVPGTFRGSNGIWELVVDTNKNLIYHFNFVK
jgi:RHS repeat-associated protein